MNLKAPPHVPPRRAHALQPTTACDWRTALLPATVFALAGTAACADEAAPGIPGPGNAIFALALVVLVIIGAAWLLKRVQPARFAGSALLRIVSSLSIGSRERIVVVEVGEEWLVIGVTAQNITPLHTLPRSTVAPAQTQPAVLPFSAWLSRARGKSDDAAH